MNEFHFFNSNFAEQFNSKCASLNKFNNNKCFEYYAAALVEPTTKAVAAFHNALL